MKFFIDTANLDQIRDAQELGALDGVTTNPSLMAKEGIKGKNKILQHYVKICEIVEGDVSAEVIATNFDEIVREGEEFAALHPQIIVKVPMVKEGVKAIKYYSDSGINLTVHLYFQQARRFWQLRLEQNYVSPFLGRLDDISTDGLQLIADI